jgi:NAD(P)-dependent dehydrogenase (short-subunit alcohol dehydrogenase family)
VLTPTGIGPVDTFIKDKFDPNGELLPPDMKCVDIDFNGPIYTSKLGIHYLRKNSSGGSLVITASASSFMPFVATDYGAAKHGCLGLMRNLNANLVDTNIRVSCITPLWTASGLVPAKQMEESMVRNEGSKVYRDGARIHGDVQYSAILRTLTQSSCERHC